MKKNIVIHIANISVLIFILTFGYLMFDNFIRAISFYISVFGFLALIYILFILSIPLLIKLKKNELTILLLSNRRLFGIYTFVFASIHVFLVLNYVFEWSLESIFNHPKYLYLLFGALAFLILIAMVVTSNDFAIRVLKKNWKRLHSLIYLALILIILHSVNLGVKFMNNYLIEVLIIALSILIILAKVYLKVFEKHKGQ
ncbi:MAG: ferric reductase-like transmembrane domain-containing protein [Candidatus Aenigmatarchaeota archaeon]